MAESMPEPNAHSKRRLQRVPSTPGKTNCSPTKKQAKKALDDQETATLSPVALAAILDERLNHFAERLEAMMDSKIEDLERRLEKKIDEVGDEIAKVKVELGESINHVEDTLRQDIDQTWDYAVNNEQYSRKNNIRILGITEEHDENLERKLIEVIKENLDEDIKPEEIEIIHRIGRPGRTENNGKNSSDQDQRSTPHVHAKPRPVIVKFLSNKSKMRILLKRRQLKGKKIVILEDMASDLAKRLKRVKERRSVENAWFTNGKIKYKQHGDPRVKEVRSWNDINNIH